MGTSISTSRTNGNTTLATKPTTTISDVVLRKRHAVVCTRSP
jgi:hypothetical protein